MEGKKLALAAAMSGALLAFGSPARAQTGRSFDGRVETVRHDGYRDYRYGDGDRRGGDYRYRDGGRRHDRRGWDGDGYRDGYRGHYRRYRSYAYGYTPYAYGSDYDDYAPYAYDNAYPYPRYRTRRIFIAFPFPHFVIRHVPIPIPVPRW
jgi:hypothetical protein